LTAGIAATGRHHDIDEARLADWMEQHVPGFAGSMQLDRLTGGQSNPTYRLRTPTASYVLRRKPSGPLLKGAHAVEREARVMKAVSAAGFPVPRVHGLCEDPAVLGNPFDVMDFVEGRIFWNAALQELPRGDRGSYIEAMNETLAALHSIPPVSVGLEDYGRIGGYVARQVDRWSQQYLADAAAGRHPAMDQLVEWLPAHLPPGDETAIVHGDYRIDNVIFHPTQARVVAVLDWELSTLGHPLADFAYNAMMYRMPRDILGGIQGLDPAGLGLPSEDEYVAAYCRRTGRAGIADLDFYVAFNMFRFAAILHGILGRAVRGTASNTQALEVGGKFARVAELAWAQIRSLD
jgi:aminoglycoside phosphotransferase (APT) family kinase protein